MDLVFLMLASLGFLFVVLSVRLASEPAIENPILGKVELSSGPCKQYGLAEFTVDLTADYTNAFDPRQVALDAEIKTPSGKRVKVPGFVNQAFNRSLLNGKEQMKPVGNPLWNIRFCPTEAGTYQMHVTLSDHAGQANPKDLSFTVASSTSDGFIKVSPKDPHYFAFDSGKTYFPIGTNMAWSGPAGTFDYNKWLSAFGAQRANYARLWLAESWSPFELTSNGLATENKGFDQINLTNAWRLDYVIKQAAANNISVLLTIDSYNTLNPDKNVSPQWEETALNAKNGGPLRVWTDFWKSATMEKVYQAKLRYLVARYGGYTNVLAWEFWNEVDLVKDFDEELVRPWHDRMATFLKGVDPYHHLITTSFSDALGRRGIDLLPGLDFFQTHTYNAPDLAWAVSYQQARKSAWGKPHLIGEIGADSQGPRSDEDPTGIQIHDPLWISTVTGCAGGAMPWWWDNLIEPKNLYPLFGALQRFTTGVNFASEEFRPTDVTLSYTTPPPTAMGRDLVFSNGPVSWSPSEFNRPQTVQWSGKKPEGSLPLSGVQHGTVNHPNLHNPATFLVLLPKETKFTVDVGEVSGYGGAALKIAVDGKIVLAKSFPDSADNVNHQSVKQYSGSYSVVVPKGKHAIVVSNPGNDWFYASYRFENLLSQSTPPLEAWALTGNRTALLWIRVQGRSWKALVEQKRVPAPAPPTQLRLKGLVAGAWKMEIWDTWNGTVTQESLVHVEGNGLLRASLPTIRTDIAVKLTLIPR